MHALLSPVTRIVIVFCGLMIFCLLPVWSVEFFVNQDGSAHLYSSYVMIGLLKGDPTISQFFAFNTFAVPNSTGHWMMAGLALFFSPFVVTKIIVSITFAGIVAASGWLRYRTCGRDGVATGLLFGAAVAFNWLWLVGFYNFLIGAVCFIFTTGLICGWQTGLTFRRTILLSALFLLAFFSHIVSFAVVAGTVVTLTLAIAGTNLKRSLATIAVSLLPILPLTILFRGAGAGDGGFSPVWRNLASVWSPSSWAAQLRTADPFILISRKALPFFDSTSNAFAIFTPLLWIATAVMLLAVATFLSRKTEHWASRLNIGFAVLFLGCIATALLAPDDFGLNNGSVLRERLLICGVMFGVPLFRTSGARWIGRTAQGCLLFVIVFQTAAVWEYALKTSRDTSELISLTGGFTATDRIGTITIDRTQSRFSSAPKPMLSNYLGAEKGSMIWDNYEIGHYLFPVIARNHSDKLFAFNLTRSNVLKPFSADFIARRSTVTTILRDDPDRFDKLIVWGEEAETEAAVLENFVLAVRGERLSIYERRNRATESKRSP